MQSLNACLETASARVIIIPKEHQEITPIYGYRELELGRFSVAWLLVSIFERMPATFTHFNCAVPSVDKARTATRPRKELVSEIASRTIFSVEFRKRGISRFRLQNASKT